MHVDHNQKQCFGPADALTRIRKIGGRRRPKTSELEVLVAIADTGSFGGAAALLDCTQSRISHAIRNLERCIGATLLTRSRTGTTPTAAGAQIVDKARAVLSLADTMVAARTQKVHGVVRLATYESVATHLLPEILNDLARSYPDVRVDVDDGCVEREDVERRVRAGTAELGIAHLPVGAGLLVRPFAEDDYIVLVQAGKRPSGRFFWQDLQAAGFIELRCSGAGSIMARCRADGMSAKAARTFSSVSTIMMQVKSGRFFSILPRLSVEPLPPGLEIVPLPHPAERTLAVIAVKSDHSPATRAVMQALHRRSPLPATVKGFVRSK